MKKVFSLLAALILLAGAAGPAGAEEPAGTEEPAGAEEELLILENPSLITWSACFAVLQLTMQSKGLPVDFSTDNGIIGYYEKNIRTGANGERVADGAAFSEKNSYMLGMGAGVDREDLWYVTMTFGADTDPGVCYNNVTCMLLAFDDISALMGGDEDEQELLNGMLDRLVFQSGSVGFQYGGKVLMRKDLGSRFIIGVDSLAFYEAFYAGSLTEYYNLDE